MSEQLQKALLVVLSNCNDESKVDEFNEWYNNVHIPDILEVPGFKRAKRYQNARGNRPGENVPQYLAVYEIEAEDAKAAVRELAAKLPKLKEAGRHCAHINVTMNAMFLPIAERP